MQTTEILDNPNQDFQAQFGFRKDNSSAIPNKGFSNQILPYDVEDNTDTGMVACKLFAFGPRKTVQGVFAILEQF